MQMSFFKLQMTKTTVAKIQKRVQCKSGSFVIVVNILYIIQSFLKNICVGVKFVKL